MRIALGLHDGSSCLLTPRNGSLRHCDMHTSPSHAPTQTQLNSLVHPTHPHPHPTHYFFSACLANTGLLSTLHVAASANAVGVVEWICTTGVNDHDIDLEREMAKVDDENGSVILSSPCIFASSSSSVRFPCSTFVQRPLLCLVFVQADGG
jgi:hypothetical protein